ncbi:MAG: hypothetical protein ACQER3_05910 [Pseudomonadota bacterium]
MRPRSRPPGPAWRAARKLPPLLAPVRTWTTGCAAIPGGVSAVLLAKVNG